MNTLSQNTRLRIYTNYGVIGLLVMFILSLLTDSLAMVIFPFIFNLILCRKFGYNKRTIIIGVISWIITSIFFGIQLSYRPKIDWGCLLRISDWEANLSYVSTMIMFSIMIWEAGFLTKKR